MNYFSYRKKIAQYLKETTIAIEKLFNRKRTDLDISSPSYSKSVISGMIKLFKFYQKSGENLNDAALIDLGVGKGWSSYILSDFVKEVKGYDLEVTISEQLGYNENQPKWQENYWNYFLSKRNNLNYYFFDGYHIDVKDKACDIIFSQAVIEHVGNNALDNDKRREWLTEIHRVLKKGGVLYISECPNRLSYAEWLAKIFGIPRHEKKFKKRELTQLLNSEGFEIKIIQYIHPYIDFYPGFLQPVWNILYLAIFKWLGYLLYFTPLRIFFHHFRIIAVKK